MSALDHARAATGSDSVAIGGGATKSNAYLGAGLIDELRLHIVPFTAGSRIFDGVPPIAFDLVAARYTPYVTHLTYRRPGLGR